MVCGPPDLLGAVESAVGRCDAPEDGPDAFDRVEVGRRTGGQNLRAAIRPRPPPTLHRADGDPQVTGDNGRIVASREPFGRHHPQPLPKRPAARIANCQPPRHRALKSQYYAGIGTSLPRKGNCEEIAEKFGRSCPGRAGSSAIEAAWVILVCDTEQLVIIQSRRVKNGSVRSRRRRDTPAIKRIKCARLRCGHSKFVREVLW